ncbi:MAG: hypothetical protein HKL81_00420 [Acidimicrobiaceae bacterium]|nr:hypothetical protein [Acidimicrobiaceae bacterium]
METSDYTSGFSYHSLRSSAQNNGSSHGAATIRANEHGELVVEFRTLLIRSK